MKRFFVGGIFDGEVKDIPLESGDFIQVPAPALIQTFTWGIGVAEPLPPQKYELKTYNFYDMKIQIFVLSGLTPDDVLPLIKRKLINTGLFSLEG